VELAAMLNLFVSAFITLFVIIDPPGCAPVFAGLTKDASPAQTRAMAAKACLIAALILTAFALFGEQLLAALDIELASFKVAGGIMLFLIALEMVFEKRTQRREQRAEKVRAANAETPEIDDVSVFPMAMPMIAGPGSIATIMLEMARQSGTAHTLVILAALYAVMLLTLLALFAAPVLMRLLGASVEAVITRLLGVLLAALAVQYVIEGIKQMVVA
jgi:multiple antibiotic resistance protein